MFMMLEMSLPLSPSCYGENGLVSSIEIDSDVRMSLDSYAKPELTRDVRLHMTHGGETTVTLMVDNPHDYGVTIREVSRETQEMEIKLDEDNLKLVLTFPHRQFKNVVDSFHLKVSDMKWDYGEDVKHVHLSNLVNWQRGRSWVFTKLRGYEVAKVDVLYDFIAIVDLLQELVESGVAKILVPENKYHIQDLSLRLKMRLSNNYLVTYDKEME